ncbi:MAG: hypothetical protein R2823_10020 [Acidimicrobiia bacterium]
MKRTILISVLILVFVAACGGGDDPLTSSSVPDEGSTTTTPQSQPETTTSTATAPSGPIAFDTPCEFVDDDSMGTILGKAVASEKLGNGLCAYSPTDDPGSGGIELLFQDVTEVGCELVFSVGGFDDEEPVDGLGTDAKFKSGDIPEIAVCFDDRISLFAILYADVADAKQALIAVVEGAAPNLP